MMITVIRHTGLGGNSIAIKLNGKKVATIYPEQQIRVELPEETATLRVSEWGFKSKTIEVQDGETIEISNRKGTNKILFFLSPLFLFTGSTLINIYGPTFRFKITALTIFAAVYLIAMFQINWYHLKEYKK